MADIIIIHGNPRRNGNTSTLLRHAAQGAEEAGESIEEIVLRNLTMSPCLEIYGCKKTGRCVINDDFQMVYDKMLSAKALILGTPIFFYAVIAHTKILIDRCQSLWVKKCWIEKAVRGERVPTRKGIFISVGATKGKKLFEGALLTIKIFFDVLDTELWKTLLYMGMDFEGDILKYPEYLHEARDAGKKLGKCLRRST